MGVDADALAILATITADLRGGEVGRLPSDAIEVAEFMQLAGLDEEKVFDMDDPDPVMVAQAELSMQKMLDIMKK